MLEVTEGEGGTKEHAFHRSGVVEVRRRATCNTRFGIVVGVVGSAVENAIA